MGLSFSKQQSRGFRQVCLHPTLGAVILLPYCFLTLPVKERLWGGSSKRWVPKIIWTMTVLLGQEENQPLAHFHELLQAFLLSHFRCLAGRLSLFTRGFSFSNQVTVSTRGSWQCSASLIPSLFSWSSIWLLGLEFNNQQLLRVLGYSPSVH